MKNRRPSDCKPAALDLLRAQLDRIETDEGLFAGACAIALHALPDLDPLHVSEALDQLADTVNQRARSGSRRAIVAHAHALLFDEQGYVGDTEDYYDPLNSYLPCVIERRRGLPITLCLVYKLVLGRLGVAVRGIDAPGHFLARIDDSGEGGSMLVDPFSGGRVLSEHEAIELVRLNAGPSAELGTDVLAIATHRRWLRRMLRNLMNVFRGRDQKADLNAMLEVRLRQVADG